MATLKLKKPGAPSGEAAPAPRNRPPVRGRSAPRKQLTLAEAQAKRARREPAARPERAARGATPAGAAPARRELPPPPGRLPDARPAAATPALATPRPPARALLQAPVPVVPHAEGERLSKRMTALGLASRREADEWIEAGWVRVDGRMAVLGQRVGPDVRIEIDPAASRQQAQRMTVLLNKPVGYVSGQAEDGHEPAVVLVRPENRWAADASGVKFHPGHLRSLVPAGRLDIDSVGLLVLTQDGRVAKQLIGDETRVEKEYLVRVEYTQPGRLPDADLALLNHGLSLDDQPLRPAKVSWQNEDQLRFVLREGKKRQIRRMCEAVGLKVIGLKRVRIGSVSLGPLPVGQWRYLRPDERFI
jgi:23S rRNA pseudouridine2604 synthase